MSVFKYIWLTAAEQGLTGNTALRELCMYACMSVYVYLFI
jgi:hypothetical protein